MQKLKFIIPTGTLASCNNLETPGTLSYLLELNLITWYHSNGISIEIA